MGSQRGRFAIALVASSAVLAGAFGTAGAASSRTATASAGGTRIVHLTTRRDAGIFSMKPNGRGRHRLRRGLVDAVSLSASGRRMVFAGSKSTPCSRCTADFFVDVFVADGRAKNARKIKRFRHSNLFSLAMSSNGRLIVASIYKGGDADLYLMRADGSDVRRLTNDNRDQSSPSFSPNGRRIVYSQATATGSQIHSMRTRGGGRRLLTKGAGANAEPVYAPNGKWIAFSNGTVRSSGIFLMRANGSGKRRLTRTGGLRQDAAPNFSPGGGSIAFQRGVGIDFDIYTVRVNGRNLRRATNIGAGLISPDWTRRP